MQEIQKILDSYTEEIKRIYGQHLHKILLYGSYARGEETSSSDIDIMILVDLDEFSIKNYADSLNEVTFDMNLDYGIMLMPIVKNEEYFEKWISFSQKYYYRQWKNIWDRNRIKTRNHGMIRTAVFLLQRE